MGGLVSIRTVSQPKPTSKSSLTHTGNERFQLIGTLGEGGMGKVLSFLDRGLDRRVAVKIARDKSERGACETLEREARVLGGLFHPNIIPVYDIGDDDEWGTFYVMPLLAEPTMQDALRALREGKTTHGRLLRLFIQVCQAVAYAHSRGIVHCDLKPENVLLGSFGEVFVADWGFAHREGDGRPTRGGTAGFMPPEQLKRGGRVDTRTDVFALGVMLYLLLTDSYPFPFIAFEEWDEAVKAGKSPFPPAVPPSQKVSDRRVPAELDEICMRALELDRNARLSTVRELVNALEAFVEGTKEKKRREKRAAELCTEGQELAESYSELLDAATSAAGELARLRARASGWADESTKEELWQAEDAAKVMSALMSRTFQASVTAFEHALEEVPGFARARQALCALYRAEHQRALLTRDDAKRRQYEARALELDDGSFASFLDRAGELQLGFSGTVEPERVTLHALVEHGPRLEAGVEVARAEVAGSLPLAPGDYLARALLGAGVVATAPVRITPGHTSTLSFALDESQGGWVHIPAGPALLGGHETSLHGDELALMPVAAFTIMRFPVTVAEYFAFIGDVGGSDRARIEALLPRDESGAALWLWDAETRSPLPALAAHWGAPERLPVIGIDLSCARAYAEWASTREGRKLRLPHDDEWEKAARGVDGRRYPWGDRFDGSLCKTRESHAARAVPEPVGAAPLDESPFGMRDCAGGVAEWVEAGSESVGAVRGGSWADWSMACHLGARRTLAKTQRSPSVGFRLVR